MQFHSYGFLFFFPLVLLGVWVFPRRMKNGLLLAASYLFYASWGLKYCLVLLGATALTYLAGLLLERRRWVLPGALVLLFGLLGVFKYTPFVLSNLARLGLPVNGSFRIAAPLGISFFTFQAAGYLWDVRRGKYPAEPGCWTPPRWSRRKDLWKGRRTKPGLWDIWRPLSDTVRSMTSSP